MNLTNLLDYGNSIYDIRGKINSIERENKDAKTKPKTVIKMLMCSTLTSLPSINSLQEAIFKSSRKRFKNIFSKDEFVPKTHAFRDCIEDTNYQQLVDMHNNIIDTMKKNKVFENHTYRGKRVVAIDGVESFETHKEISDLHTRNHKDGSIGYYYKSLGMMYIADNVDIMLDLVPFEKREVEDDKEHNNKIKSEGEITVLKRIVPNLKKNNIDIAILDCMFMNAPCLNALKSQGIDGIVKLTDERRTIYKDAKGLFTSQDSVKEYEVVEVHETKKIRYSKGCKKKNKEDIDIYEYTRNVTDKPLNKTITLIDKTTNHPKKDIQKIKTEKVIKRVKIYSDIFELENYEYGPVRVLKVEETVIEKRKEVVNEMYIVTTLIDEDLEFITDLMHRRWKIELNGFRTLKTRYHMDHLFVGTNNAIRLIHYLIMIIYNLIELYFNVHTRKYRNRINFKTLLEDYKIDILTKPIYKYFEENL